MAIEKVRANRYEFTAPTVIQLSIAGVLVIVSIIIGWSAFKRWQLKSALLSAYAQYDSNLAARALPDLDAALEWDPAHVGARQLRAKILCDNGKLKEAMADYTALTQQGYDRPHVRAGMGVVTLKMADQAGAEEVDALVTKARGYFEAASSIPEGMIGLGHCDLMLASKTGAAAKQSAAKAQFQKVKKHLESDHNARRSITRDGLVDYYSGLGKAMGAEGTYNEEASEAFKACYQYARSWPVPMVNMLVSESMRLDQAGYSIKQMDAARPDLERFRGQMNLAWRGNEDLYKNVKDAWLQFTLAMAKAYADAGNMQLFGTLTYEVTQNRSFKERYEPLVFRAKTLTRQAQRPGLPPDVRRNTVVQAYQAYEAVVQSPSMNEGSLKPLKAAAYNNGAWAQVYMGDLGKNQVAYQQALEKILAAIELKDDEYVLHRNAVVIMKRQRRPERDYKKHLDKANELRGDAYEEDFRALAEHAAGR